MHLEVGVDLAVVGDLRLGQRQELLGVQDVAGWLGLGDGLEQRLGLPAQGGRHPAVQLDAQLEEVVGLARLEHLELELHLAVLGAQQVPERGVLDGGDVDVVQHRPDDLRVGLELAVGEVGLGVLALEEVVLDVVGVDRRDVEEEAEGPGELGQGVVDRAIGRRDLRGLRRPGVRAHRSRARACSSTGTVAPRARTVSARRSWSTSAVHSSMKVFLNSSARQQPTPG